jgi:CBS domain-containing protein
VFLDGHDGEAFPVVTDQGVVGFVSLRTAQGVSADRPVEEAMVGTDAVLQAGPDEPMEAVARRLGEQQRNTILVVDGGRLVGVIEPEDIERFFRLGASPRRRQDRPSRPDIPPSV